jgi:hypothetical protein
MASNNNPETAPAAAPATAAFAAESAAQVPAEATFTVNGKSFAVKSFAATNPDQIATANAAGEQLYAALTPEYKKQADVVREFLISYKDMVALTGDAGGTKTLERYWAWVKAGGKAGKDGANAAMIAIDDKMKSWSREHVPGAEPAQVIGTLGDFVSGTLHGTVTGAPRLVGAAGVGVGIVGGALDFTNISPEQAQTFAALYAGLLESEREHNAALPMINWPWSKEGSQIFNNLDTYGTATMRYVASLAVRVWEAVTGKPWRGMPNFGELIKEETFRKENRKVTEAMTVAGPVAGLAEGPELISALQGSLSANKDGKIISVTATPDGLKIEQAKNEKGEPVTVIGRATDEAAAQLNRGLDNKSAAYKAGDTIGLVANAGLIGAAGVGTVLHAPKIVAGVAHGFTQTYENAPLKRAVHYTQKAEGHLHTAQFDWKSPSTWFAPRDVSAKSQTRSEIREHQAKVQIGHAAERIGEPHHVAEARASAMLDGSSAPKVKFTAKVAEFFSHPFTSTGEAIGKIAGNVADAAQGVKHAAHAGIADIKGVMTGVNPGLAEEGFANVSKVAGRFSSVVRVGSKGLGVTGVALGAAEDSYEGYEAAKQHDGRKVAKQVGRVVGGATGGIAGGAAAGAAAGAAIGVWFGGVGAVPAAIIGGGVGMLGAWGGFELGRLAGGTASEAVAGDLVQNTVFKGEKPITRDTVKTLERLRVQPTGALPADPAVSAAAVAATQQARLAEHERMLKAKADSGDVFAMASMAVNRVFAGKVTTGFGATVPALPASASGNPQMAAARPIHVS